MHSGRGCVSELMESALGYALRGWRVFPLHGVDANGCTCGKPDCERQGKHPRTEHGLDDATRDVARIRDWWQRWPNANIGIATGAASGLVVLDIDPRHSGLKTLEALKRKHGGVPRTLTVLTGSGGHHAYFAHPGHTKIRNSSGRLGDGIDVRGDGGYVVAPPSVHRSGNHYKIVREAEPAPMPPWVDASTNGTTAIASTVADAIPEGERNATLTSLAGSMRRRGMSEQEILAALQVTNRERCKPPMTDEEVAGVARSVSRYQPERKPTPTETPTPNGVFEMERLADVQERSIVFLDKPLWQADAFHLLVGRKGVGKGTLLADLAARVTRGELGAKRNVVWIGSEDSSAIDIKPRVRAAVGDAERVWTVKSWPQFPRDLDVLTRSVEQTGDVGLVIIDPVANHVAGMNTDSESIRDAIAPLNVLADELKTVVIGVRHLTEKQMKELRGAVLGSSAWYQTPRAVIAVVHDEEAGVSHVQCIAGNRLPANTPGRIFRLTGVKLPDLEEEVTRAVWEGESAKDVETLFAASSGRENASKSAQARALILDLLEAAPERRMESDTLDALVTARTGLAKQTIKNARSSLADESLVKNRPENDEQGRFVCWFVERTLAPRPEAHETA